MPHSRCGEIPKSNGLLRDVQKRVQEMKRGLAI